MLIITLLTKRSSSNQRWKLCIMYHIGSVPPHPSYFSLFGCYSLPSSAYSLSLSFSRICMLRIHCVCAIAAAAAATAVIDRIKFGSNQN